MNPEQFTYWLQGFFELSEADLTPREQIIKDHLKTVFHKVTPTYTHPLDRQTGPVPMSSQPIMPNIYPTQIQPSSPNFPPGTVIC